MIQIYLVRNSSQCHTSLLTASDTARIAAINSEVDYYIQWTLCQKSGAPLDSSVAEAFEYARNVFHPWIGEKAKRGAFSKPLLTSLTGRLPNSPLQSVRVLEKAWS